MKRLIQIVFIETTKERIFRIQVTVKTRVPLLVIPNEKAC